MRCPLHLLRDGMPAEKSISLRTTDRSVALERLPAARMRLMEFFQNGRVAYSATSGIKRTVEPNRRPEHSALPFLTLAEADGFAREYFFAAQRELDLAHADDRNMTAVQREQREAELSDLLARINGPGDDDGIDPIVETEIGILRKTGRRSPFHSDPSRLLRSNLLRALRQLWRVELARLRGDFSERITDTLFISSNPVLTTNNNALTAGGETLGEALDRYRKELLTKTRAAKTQDRYRAEIAHIEAFFGSSMPMSDLTRSLCNSFRDTFARLPPNFTKREGALDVRGLAAASGPNDPVLAHATLSKYLDALSRFTRWADKEDIIAKDYGEGLEPLGAKPDGSTAKLPFEIDELERFFARPVYTDCINDVLGFSKSGPNIVRRARYWAPLIGLFGGLRSGEIFQLTPNHFRNSPNGTPFMVLTKDMNLKNENAEREIPIHATLLQIGLLDWVNRRKNRPSELLFPEISADKYGSVSSVFGKRFRSDLKYLELGDRRAKLTFHSFRHTFKRALDREQVSEQEKDELCGWARAKKTGRRYGVGLEADKLNMPLQQVRYDIDLTPLLKHASLAD